MSHSRDEEQSAASRWLDDEVSWNDESDLRELNTLAIHAQLQQLFEGEAEREARVQRVVLAYRESLETESVPPKPEQENQPYTKRRWDRRWTVAVAASLVFLCVFGLLIPTQESSALAAIEKAIIASQQTVTRKYEVYLKTGPMGSEVQVDLFSQGKTDFFVELKHFPVQPATMGGNAESRWAIVGNQRWDSIDQGTFPLDAVLDRVSLRFLILHDVLASIASDYEYVKMQGQTPQGESVVTATLTKLQSQRSGTNGQLSGRIQLPDRIVVRIDDLTGVVKDLKLNWDHRQIGILELKAEYVGEVDRDINLN